ILDLHQIVYKSEKDDVTEVDLEIGKDEDTYTWKAWALIDRNCRRVYAFKVLLTNKPRIEGGKPTALSFGYVPLPIYGNSSDDNGDEILNMESRPIRYATETVTIPAVERIILNDVVLDDTI